MTVRGLPVPVREPYITRRELAMLMGVSVKKVDRMVKEGMPSVLWGLRTRRFQASTALAWANGRGQDAGSPPKEAA
jgi:hypothetical protein